jgi:hypothetical protein
MTPDDRLELAFLIEERLGLMGVVGPPSPADLAHATDCARRLHSITYGATPTAPAPPLMATQTTLFGAKK